MIITDYNNHILFIFDLFLSFLDVYTLGFIWLGRKLFELLSKESDTINLYNLLLLLLRRAVVLPYNYKVEKR